MLLARPRDPLGLWVCAGKADPLSQEQYLVVAQLGGDTRGGTNENIFLAAPISPQTIASSLPVKSTPQ